MYYDAPKSLPAMPSYAEIRTYTAPAQQGSGIVNECYVELTQTFNFNCLDMGGYSFRGTAGTANATISGMYQHNISFMPREGVIPEVEIRMQHIADLFNLSQEE